MMTRGWRNLATDHAADRTTYVTTSWDDGHAQDQQMAELLHRYGLPGTFYVAPQNVETPARQRLTPAQIASLGQTFEIGGHTLHHRRLPDLSASEAIREITEGKDDLENALGASLRTFCYPGGAYEAQHVSMVRRAGFIGARTVARGVLRPTPAFEMGTSTQAYRHLVDGPAALSLSSFDVRRAARLLWHWDLLAIALFDLVLERGGIFHLWGHSWEVGDNGDWARLEDVFSHISGRGEVSYVDNGELAVLTGGDSA
jgi:peptidoglycan/xylan/chitin deacetylase (PgdA/CDA1 family)